MRFTFRLHIKKKKTEKQHSQHFFFFQFGLGARGEGDDRGWDGWMVSLTWWTWVSVNSGSWWWTGRPGVLRFMGSQRVGHDWATDLIWSDSWFTKLYYFLVNIKVNQLYIHIYPLFLFLDSFPIQAVIEYWVENPVLYSRFALVVSFYIQFNTFFKEKTKETSRKKSRATRHREKAH